MANSWGESGTTWSQGDWGQQNVTTVVSYSGLSITSTLNSDGVSQTLFLKKDGVEVHGDLKMTGVTN